MGPNQCNTFIPSAAGQLPMRQKATLHILDGLIGVYEGGPGTWNTTWATWPYKALFFATDPVAMDHVGWNIIDAKRVQEGWQPVSRMGLLQDMPVAVLSRRLAALGGNLMSRRFMQCSVICGLLGFVVSLLWLSAGGQAEAETCLSPFVKRLDRIEKVLYVFCVDADAKDNDFLAVIDADPGSPDY